MHVCVDGQIKHEEEPPTKQSRLEDDLSPDWPSAAATVTLQSAAVDPLRTPLSATLLQSPGGVSVSSGAFINQTFTFPVAALASPLCTSEFGYIPVPLTPSSGGTFLLPSLVPGSPCLTSGPISTAQVVVTTNSSLNDVYENQIYVVDNKQQGNNTDLHLPDEPVESLFPQQATLSEKLAYMKHLEEHPERRVSFGDFVQESSQTNLRIARQRSNSLHRTDSQVMSTLNARLRQRVAGALNRRKSEADIGRKIDNRVAPPLMKATDGVLLLDSKRRRPRRSTSVAEMRVPDVKESELIDKRLSSEVTVSTPGPPPSLIPIPACLVNENAESEEILVPPSAGEVVVEMEEEKSVHRQVRRFPSNGTLSEKLAYLKWRESVSEEEEDDLGYKKVAGAGSRDPRLQGREQQNSSVSAFSEP